MIVEPKVADLVLFGNLHVQRLLPGHSPAGPPASRPYQTFHNYPAWEVSEDAVTVYCSWQELPG
jgi:hypothetical protein